MSQRESESPSNNPAGQLVLSPADEITRLKRLYELSMTLSGDPMDIFVHIARMIGELLDVKVVCLSEIQGRELYFLSVYAQGEIYVNAGSCPLNITPCATVEATKDLRIIHDVASLFPEASFLKEHRAFSYCGFPALDNNGQVVAVTCLLDDRPHAFTAEDQELLRIVGQRIGMEIERKRLDAQKDATLAALQASEQQNQLILDNAGDGIVITDARIRIIAVNKALCRISGYSEEELIGQSPRIWKSGHHGKDFYRVLWASLKEIGQWRGEIWNRRKNGESIPLLENISVIRNQEGRINHYVAIMTDITGIKQFEERLSYLSHYDPLTGLANRILLGERLGYAMRQSKRLSNSLAVLFIDLDRFKNINDSFGHSLGDQILQEVGRRLASAVRGSDTVARLGGDEFAVIVGELDRPESAGIIANKLRLILSEPISIAERELIVTPSIGIGIFPEDGQTSDDLVKHADTAMYHAKKRGRNNCQFYSPNLGAEVYQNLILESALRNAQERGELTLHYQPQFELETGNLVGAEALIRWHHPDFGPVCPERFIPLAEESGQIVTLGEWVMKTACAQTKQWQRRGMELDRVGVNVSPLQIQQGDFAESVARILDETGLPPHYLELEVTERFIMEVERSIPVLEALRQMGVELAIDDFGTSYSSLKYLKFLPIQRLKIDQSFVKDIPDDLNGNAIARAIIALAKSLQLRVVAEGIENEAQRDFLLDEGCHCAQGFFFGKPVAASDFERLYLLPAQ